MKSTSAPTKHINKKNQASNSVAKAKHNSASSNSKALFGKLDPSQHARRIEQRRKTVAFGKNTAGYFEYIQQIPKEKRRPKSMKHPATPDPTLDIPTKRWQGMIKAWRKALHQYDPTDLAQAFEEAQSKKSEPTTVDIKTVKGQELALAQEKGLLVDMAQPSNTESSPTTCRSDKLLDQWAQQQPDDLDDAVLDDSDDEML